MNPEKNYLYKIGKILCQKHDLSYVVLNDFYKMNMPAEKDMIKDEAMIYESFDQVLEQSKRAMTGSFYTPDDLAEKMVQLAFIDYFYLSTLLSKEEALNIFAYKKITFDIKKKTLFITKLQSMKIIDPACGTGNFIKQGFKLLKETYELFGVDYSVKSISQQLYGLDLQETPVELLKLWFLDQHLSNKETYNFNQIICVDTITYESDLKFDLVIGNPPYLGEKGNKAVFAHYKHLPGYEGKMDLFYFFIYKGFELLKPKGVLNFITTNYFITADGANKLRLFLKNKVSFLSMINLDACKLFKDAPGMHNLIFSITPEKHKEAHILTLSKDKTKDLSILFSEDYVLKQKHLYSEDGNMVIYEKKEYHWIIEKILSSSVMRLEDLVNINQGIVSGADRVTQNMLSKKLSHQEILKYNIQLNDPIFVLKEPGDLKPWLKPFYKNSDIKPYRVDALKHQWILYITDEDEMDEKGLLYHHLRPYKQVLDARREVENNKRKWYALQWYRRQEIFEKEKIVAPQRSKFNKFAYVNGPFYASADIYYLTGEYLKPLLGILNSKLMYFWLYTRGKRKGKDLELYAKPLSQIPLPDLRNMKLEDITKLVEKIMVAYDLNIQNAIDQWVYKIYNLSESDISVVENVYLQKGSTNEK